MSFADDKGFKGVVVSNNTDMTEAIRKTWALAINPSGQVAGFEIDSSEVDKAHLWELMSKETLVERGYIDAGNCTLGDLESD